ncbi:hypothetical protein SLA2020_265380 [Shorea laevis]
MSSLHATRDRSTNQPTKSPEVEQVEAEDLPCLPPSTHHRRQHPDSEDSPKALQHLLQTQCHTPSSPPINNHNHRPAPEVPGTNPKTTPEATARTYPKALRHQWRRRCAVTSGVVFGSMPGTSSAGQAFHFAWWEEGKRR